MKLFERDYRYITETESQQYNEVCEKELYMEDGRKLKIGRRNLFRQYPKAVRHNKQLFPNNWLDIVELEDTVKLKSVHDNFVNLLNSTCNEQDILSYIKTNKAYFIIGSIFKNYNFGHHEAYIFPEFQLGTDYRPDYLLVGKSSGGYEFIFIELEHPYGSITKDKGNLGTVFRKGLEQVTDWRIWIDKNFGSLRQFFSNNIKSTDRLPLEFIDYDCTRIHYVVVAGRRKDFNDLTYNIKRDYLKKQDILLLHYDNIVDLSKNIIGKPTY